MYSWFATAASGIEGIVGQELKQLGLTPAVEPGRCCFTASPADALRACMWLRAADRVFLLAGRFSARSFDELFEATRALAWRDLLPHNAALPVRGSCVRSQLMSVPDCQRIIKKAIAVGLSGSHEAMLPENGPECAVEFHIVRDEVIIGIDACGAPLHKRGYRTGHHEAPLRETLAAAVLLSSPWRPGLPFCDPMCGSGTLLIEAAMMAANIAPNLSRLFSMLAWPMSSNSKEKLMREEAREKQARVPFALLGSDADASAVQSALEHAHNAGVSQLVAIKEARAEDLRLAEPRGWVVANPPYGVRLGDADESQAAARCLRQLRADSGWRFCVITPDAAFERAFGMKAAKHRRFYNGRIECRALVF